MIYRLNMGIDIVMAAVSLYYQENFESPQFNFHPRTPITLNESVIMNDSSEGKLDKIGSTTSGKC